jgi:hypothetical protein
MLKRPAAMMMVDLIPRAIFLQEASLMGRRNWCQFVMYVN